MKNIDSKTHVRGESIYVDDIPLIEGTLYGLVFDSPVAHGKIKSLDLKDGLSSPGVVDILTKDDISGDPGGERRWPVRRRVQRGALEPRRRRQRFLPPER